VAQPDPLLPMLLSAPSTLAPAVVMRCLTKTEETLLTKSEIDRLPPSDEDPNSKKKKRFRFCGTEKKNELVHTNPPYTGTHESKGNYTLLYAKEHSMRVVPL